MSLRKYITAGKLVLVLSGFLIVAFGCSVEHHIVKMEKHREEAEKAGAVFEKDIEWKYIIKSDTIWETIEGLTAPIVVHEVDSIPYEVERLVYVPMSRQERLHLKDQMKFQARMYEDSLRFQNKTYKREVSAYQDSLKFAKQMHNSDNRTDKAKSRHENKSWWKFWLILGLCLGAAGMFLLLKYIPFLKKLVL